MTPALSCVKILTAKITTKKLIAKNNGQKMIQGGFTLKKRCLILLCAAFTLACTACGNAKFEKEYGKVTLCDYKKLSVEKPVSPVTEEDVEMGIENLLYEYAETNEVTRASKENDIVVLAMTAKKGDETYIEYTEDEPYYFYLGYQEYGEEFDKKLTGIVAGDKMIFSITYGDDAAIPDFANATIDYEVNVIQVLEETVPELTDKFIKETLEYASKEEMEKAVREELEAEKDQEGEAEVREALIQEVVDNSKFESYSDDLYKKCEKLIEESYYSYAEMFGFETLEEIYEAFGKTEADIKEEIVQAVYRNIAIEAIAKEEKISVTEKEFESMQTEIMDEYDYESLDDLYNDYGDEEVLQMQFLESEVLDFLQKHATIKEVVASEGELEFEE